MQQTLEKAQWVQRKSTVFTINYIILILTGDDGDSLVTPVRSC